MDVVKTVKHLYQSAPKKKRLRVERHSLLLSTKGFKTNNHSNIVHKGDTASDGDDFDHQGDNTNNKAVFVEPTLPPVTLKELLDYANPSAQVRKVVLYIQRTKISRGSTLIPRNLWVEVYILFKYRKCMEYLDSLPKTHFLDIDELDQMFRRCFESELL